MKVASPTGTAARENADVLVVLTSLVAEGTPVLTRALCREWKESGLRPAIMTLYPLPNDLAPEFEALGVPVHQANLPSEGYSRYSALALATARICRQIKPRAVLSMPFGWHAFIAMGAKLAGVPTVAAHVGSYPPYWQGKSFWKFKAEVWSGRPFTTGLICCSRYVEEGVRKYFPGAHGTLWVVYNGAPIDEIRARAEAARRARAPGGPFRVGMVARLEISKDHATLLEGAAIAAREVDLELWLVGDGSLRKELERMADKLGLGERARFLGSRRDVPEVLGNLDAFAFSVKPDEGLGIALIEAMAAKLPIVASDVGACREVLGVDESILFPYRDAPALAAALVRLVTTPRRAADLDRAADRAQSLFSIRAMAEGYAKCLRLRLW